MRKFTIIDNQCVVKWGISYPEAILFEWLYSLPSWAKSVSINNESYYFAAYSKACADLPALTDKVDTMYRYYKKLELAGLISIKKLENKEYVLLTEKAKEWNRNSQSERSDKLPTKLGQTSEQNSDDYPTYRENTIIESKNIDSPLNSPAKPTKKTFLPIGPGFCVESKTSQRKLFLRHDSAVDTYNRYKKNLLENQSGLTLYDLTYTENITLNITNAAGVEIPVVLPIADNIKTNEDMKLAIEASNFLYEAGFYCFDTYRPYLLSYRNTGDIKRLWDIYLK